MTDLVQTEASFAKPARRTPTDFSFIRFQVEGAVARLTLQRPEHNLLNEQMLRELADGVGLIAENGAVKMIILDAAGKLFCAGVDIGEQSLQRRSFHVASREAAVVVAFGQASPALVDLAADESLGGLALGVQRVELLFQPFLGGLARVDGTADQRQRGCGFLAVVHAVSLLWLRVFRKKW